MAEGPQLKPEIKRVLLQKYKENTAGEIASINAVSSIFCDAIKSYPPNTKGVIQSILQLGHCLGSWAESVEDRLGKPGSHGGADLCCLLPQAPNVDYDSAGVIGDNCGTEDCPPTPHPHPHDPLDPCCGTSPDINPDFKYPLGGVECLHPDAYEWHNGGVVGMYCEKTHASPDCLVPSRLPYGNAGVIGCGNPNELHWVDYYWPARLDWCNAGFTGHNCTECEDPLLMPHGGATADCNVCRRGGVENYRPEFIEYDNAGTTGDSCPSAYGRPTCLIPEGDHYCCYDNSGLVGVGDPDTENYVDHYWPARCEYANAGLIGTGCAIGGDEWLDALDLPVETGQCYAPYLAEYNNSGLMEGSWHCDQNKKPNVGEHWFDPAWGVDYANSGAIIAVDPPEPPVDDGPPPDPDCCPEVGLPLPPVADDCHTHACWLPDKPEFENAGLKTSRECNICRECDSTPAHGQPVVVVSDSPPYEPCEGVLWFNPATLTTMIYYCDASTCQWVPTAVPLGGTGGAQAMVSDTPPPGAVCGSLWHDSVRQETRVFYDDGNSRQWVPVSLAKANSTETELAMRRELDSLKNEIAELKMALAGRAPD